MFVLSRPCFIRWSVVVSFPDPKGTDELTRLFSKSLTSYIMKKTKKKEKALNRQTAGCPVVWPNNETRFHVCLFDITLLGKHVLYVNFHNKISPSLVPVKLLHAVGRQN